MQGVNKVILVGNLGKDPEIKTLESGAKVSTFSIATTESYKDKNTGERVDKTEWHNIELWKGLAEVAEKYLKKGSQVYIEGKIQYKSYGDGDDKKHFTSILGRELKLLGSKNESTNGNTPPQAQAPVSDNEQDDLPF